MRTKILKFGMPLLAFLLAIVFAFATENNAPKDDALVQGYIFWNNDCVTTTKVCNNQGTIPCKEAGNQVYSLDLGKSCANAMTHRPL
ncbi:MAG: hypothetical protein CL526_07820 [Aequorivita sp.]|nr:hypothetical protein [Aequorivita sp.]|tara:strand:- start:32558 stop:32818 length:261 start_codon:yes stop_codon:yes gene_type:complete